MILPIQDTPTTNLAAIYGELGISLSYIAHRYLPLQAEPPELVVAQTGSDPDGTPRDYLLTPSARRAWAAMHTAAMQDGVPLAIVSAFRSVQRQTDIIRAKLGRGERIEDILRVNAPPGTSEHHTGRAIDIGSSQAASLEEVFETTLSFSWLCANAGRFGFVMSYPRGNAQGFVYEPWHWCWHSPDGPEP